MNNLIEVEGSKNKTLKSLSNVHKSVVFIEPYSVQLYNDGLFDPTPRPISRDGVLRPWIRLRELGSELGVEIHTADLIPSSGGPYLYYCNGSLRSYRGTRRTKNVILASFYRFGPPIGVESRRSDTFYHLDELCRDFRRVYLVSPLSEINKCCGTNWRGPVQQIRVPQCFANVFPELWSNQNRDGIVMINSYHRSPRRKWEYYSERTRALRHFGSQNEIDLYGFGWDYFTEPWSLRFFPRRLRMILKTGRILDSVAELVDGLQSRDAIKRVWRGPCINAKYDTLAKYRFSISYESMSISGFFSEKLFDCLLAGTIPIYLGDPDITDVVPSECFIDKRQFGSYEELGNYLRSLSDKDVYRMREAGRDFIESPEYRSLGIDAFAQHFWADVLDDMNLTKTQ